MFHRQSNPVVSLISSSIPSRSPTSSNFPTEAPSSARLMAMKSTVLSKIPGGMGSAMAQNLWNLSTPQGKAIWWMTDEDGLEVEPVDSKTVLDRSALAVIFYATGGQTWIEKAHLLSKMSVCHWNEYDEDDYVITHFQVMWVQIALMVALKLMDYFLVSFKECRAWMKQLKHPKKHCNLLQYHCFPPITCCRE